MKIQASSIPGHYVLPRVLGGFHREYPEVELALGITDTDGVIQAVRENKVDVGLVGTPVKERSIECLPFVQDELVAIFPGGHSLPAEGCISIMELSGETLVWREEGSGTRQTIEHEMEKAGISFPANVKKMEMGSTGAVVAAVEAGLGVSIVSLWAVAGPALSHTLEIRRLTEISLQRRLYLIRNRAHAGRTAEAFVRHFGEGEGREALDRALQHILEVSVLGK